MKASIEATVTRDTVPDDLMMACAEVPSGAISENDYLLIQGLRLADDHRKHCAGEACAVSLHAIRQLLARAGIQIPRALTSRFM